MGNPIDRLLQEEARKNPVDALLQGSNSSTSQPAESANRPGGIRRVLNTVGNLTFNPVEVSRAVAEAPPLKEVAGTLLTRARRFFTEQLPNFAVAVTNPGSQQQAEANQMIGQTVSGLVESATQSVNDYVRGVRDAEGVVSTTGKALAPSVKLPLALVDMVVAPVADFMEAGLGVNLSDEFGSVSPLTAEQNANAIQTTAANVAALATGMAIEKSIATEAVAPAITKAATSGVSELSAAELAAASGGSVPSSVLRRAAVSGGGGGAAAGAVFGTVEGAGRDELGPMVVAYTIAGGALGTALNVAVSKFAKPQEQLVNGKPISQIVAEARNETTSRAAVALRTEADAESGIVAGQARQLNNTEATTLNDGIASAIAINSNPDDLARAVISRNLMVPGRSVIDGVSEPVARQALNMARSNDYARLLKLGLSEEDARFVANQREIGTVTGKIPAFESVQAIYDKYDLSLPSTIYERGSTAYLYKKPNNTYRVLLNNDVSPLTEAQIQAFSRYGYTPGEQVSFQGKNYRIVRPGSPDGQYIVVSDGVNETLFHRSEVIQTQLQTLTPEMVSKYVENDFINFISQEAKSRLKQTPEPAVRSNKVHDYKIPERYAKSAPKFTPPGRKGQGAVPIEFASDFDRAAYIIGSKTGKSMTKDALLAPMRAYGVSRTEDVLAHAALVRQRVKDIYASNPSTSKITLASSPFYGQQAIPQSALDAAIGNVTTAKSFAELVADYGKMIGVEDVASLKSLEQDLGNRLSNALERLMDPEEVKIIHQINKEVQQTQVSSRENAKYRDVDAFILNAQQNGIYVEKGGPGVYVLRDVTSGREITRGSNIRRLNDFINNSRQFSSTNLDGGSNGAGVPPLNRVEGMMTNGDNPRVFNIKDDSYWLNSLRENPILGDVSPWATKTADYIATMDRKFGTKLYERVYRRIQNGAVEPLVVERRQLDKQISHFNDLLGKRTQSQRELLFDYIETDSPENIIANGVRKGVPLDEQQVDWAKSIASTARNKEVQLATLAYRGMRARVQGNPALQAKLLGEYQTFLIELGLDSKEVNLAQALGSTYLDNLQLRDTFVLAEAYRGDGVRPSMTKAEFAKAHNLTPEDVSIASRISSEYFDKLASERALTSQLNNYITHRKVSWEAPETWRRYENLVGDEAAYFELSRQGLLDVYERDPIKAMQQYAYAHLYTKYLVPAIKEADIALGEELAKAIPGLPTVAPEIAARAQGYFRDLQGMRTASDKRWTMFGGSVFEKLGIKDGRVTVERFKATLDSAFQGARISAGIRDYVAAVVNYYPAFGASRASRFAKMVYTISGDEVARLADAGKIIEMGLSSIETPIEGQLAERVVGQTGRTLNAINKKSLELSGQPWVYRRVQAAAYTEAFDNAAKGIARYRESNNPQQLIKDIDLDFYDVPQRQQFEQLLTSGMANADELAAEYIANETRGMLAGRYGFGNNPSGWTSIEGRLAGHYGQWTVQHKSYVLKLLTNGEGWQGRYKRMARYAGVNGALLLSKPFTGINTMFYAPLLGLGFAGGPAIQAATQAAGVISGREDAGDYLESTLPWKNGWRHAYIPGSYAASDYFTAAQMIGEGDFAGAAARLGRVKIDE